VHTAPHGERPPAGSRKPILQIRSRNSWSSWCHLQERFVPVRLKWPKVCQPFWRHPSIVTLVFLLFCRFANFFFDFRIRNNTERPRLLVGTRWSCGSCAQDILYDVDIHGLSCKVPYRSPFVHPMKEVLTSLVHFIGREGFGMVSNKVETIDGLGI